MFMLDFKTTISPIFFSIRNFHASIKKTFFLHWEWGPSSVLKAKTIKHGRAKVLESQHNPLDLGYHFSFYMKK